MDGGKVKNVELSTFKVKLTPKEFAVSARPLCLYSVGMQGWHLRMCL